jgi:hypothetical protein
MATEGTDRARRYLDRIDQVLNAARKISRSDGDLISATHLVRALLGDEIVTALLGPILPEGVNAQSETRTPPAPQGVDGDVVLTTPSFRRITYSPVVAASLESGYEEDEVNVFRTRLRLLRRLLAADQEASRYLEEQGVDVAALVQSIDEAESS